jgi:hypothetical protein
LLTGNRFISCERRAICLRRWRVEGKGRHIVDRYILLKYLIWRVIREEELADFRGNIKRILNSSPEVTAAIRLILKTKPLDQFKATACESHTESRRSEDEERRGFKSYSSGVKVL